MLWWFDCAWPRQWHDWRYGLVRVGVALLEEVCHCGNRLQDPCPSCLEDEDVELSAPPAPCLPGCCHVPALMILD